MVCCSNFSAMPSFGAHVRQCPNLGFATLNLESQYDIFNPSIVLSFSTQVFSFVEINKIFCQRYVLTCSPRPSDPDMAALR